MKAKKKRLLTKLGRKNGKNIQTAKVVRVTSPWIHFDSKPSSAQVIMKKGFAEVYRNAYVQKNPFIQMLDRVNKFAKSHPYYVHIDFEFVRGDGERQGISGLGNPVIRFRSKAALEKFRDATGRFIASYAKRHKIKTRP